MPEVHRAGRGTAIVATLAVTETVSWGVLYYGFTVFLRPMSEELQWSRGSITVAFSVALLTQGVAAVFVGRWLDRHSPRLLMTAGSIAATGGVLAWSRVQHIGLFVLLWAALGVVMATVLYEPAFVVVTKWFVERRRQALTAVTLVAGFASTIFLPLENALIEALGWRRALVVLAVLLGAITIPLHALVLRPPPSHADPPSPTGMAGTAGATDVTGPAAGARPTDPPPDRRAADAVRQPMFWMLAGSFVTSSFVTSALAVHQIAYLVDQGHGAAFAAAATGTLGAMQVPGRLLFAPLERWFSRRTVTVAVFAQLAAGVALLSVTTATMAVWVFVVLYGMGRGMSTLLRATLVGDLYGAAHYGSISGVISALVTVATASGPLAAGLLFDATGSYRVLLPVLVGIAGVATGLAALIERPRRLAGPSAEPAHL